ncbi:hypothetical protein F8566_45690 [Actinomadura rudentiformis]|uniref:Uncharacterized protein n=1 Tax=Actinomadura rudentiformis TaxID=359158 RepID=A0A6H9YJN2_9ACTN|nr:hypothetical protein F8566_45690 [Actinomadura rudentiformis]
MTPELKSALRMLRCVRARRSEDSADILATAEWREAIAEVLDELAVHLLFPEDRAQAAREAAEAREQASRLRLLPPRDRSSRGS